MSSPHPFIGIQIDPVSRDDANPGAFCDRLAELAPINRLVCFFKETEVRRRLDPAIEATFYDAPPAPDAPDWIDGLTAAAATRDMQVYLSGGESDWRLYGPAFRNFDQAARIDCHGQPTLLTCVNRPAWREFQFALHASLFTEHPQVAGFMFMHERAGPLQQLLNPDTWQGELNPGCFCPTCCELGRARGIDPARARTGFIQAATLLRDRPPALIRDGIFTSLFRLWTAYPEMLAWENLQWDSLHRYRADLANAIRAARPGAKVGFHFQHSSLNANLPWRAGDDPARIATYADFVKASIYPGCSGLRYRRALTHARSTWLGDLSETDAHHTVSAWFNRSPDNGRDALGQNGAKPDAVLPPADDEKQAPFGLDWVEHETRRITDGCAPVPHYAGLGFDIPGGEKVDTPELVAAATEACLRGGATGFVLSRHLSEMKPENLRAAGQVIRTRLLRPE